MIFSNLLILPRNLKGRLGIMLSTMPSQLGFLQGQNPWGLLPGPSILQGRLGIMLGTMLSHLGFLQGPYPRGILPGPSLFARPPRHHA